MKKDLNTENYKIISIESCKLSNGHIINNIKPITYDENTGEIIEEKEQKQNEKRFNSSN